jgi:hypothetical protein
MRKENLNRKTKMQAYLMLAIFSAAMMACVMTAEKAAAAPSSPSIGKLTLSVKKTSLGNLYVTGRCQAKLPGKLTMTCAGQTTHYETWSWTGNHLLPSYKVTPGKIFTARYATKKGSITAKFRVKEACRYKTGATRIELT